MNSTKTIRQLAEEVGVTVQAIHKRIQIAGLKPRRAWDHPRAPYVLNVREQNKILKPG